MSDSKARPRAATKSAPAAAADDAAKRPLKIGEAARLLGVEPYVLRFWETQFGFLRPRHTRSRHRFYLPKDIETLKLIKRLLHGERYTIEGARKYIRETGLDALLAQAPAEAGKSVPAPAPCSKAAANSGVKDESVKRTLAEMRRELEALHKLLDH